MGLGARLALVFASVAAATALLVGGAAYVTTDRQVLAEVDSFLEQRADEIKDGVRDKPRDRRDRGEDDTVTVAVGADAEVQILDDDGEVVSNTGLLLPVNSGDVALAERDDRSVYRTETIGDEDYRIITVHLDGVGAVQVARSLDESSGLVDILQKRLLLVAGAVASAAAAVGWFVAQRTTRPLRALTSAVDEVAQTRDFSVPVPTSGQDEVGRLGRGFNRMLGALQTSQEQQRRLVQDAAHELRTPLTSMTANVEWLMRADDLDPAVRKDTMAGVRRELGELNDVIAEIIELATDSREAPELVPTDLVVVVEGAVERFRRRSGREVVVDATPVTVLGDADSLARAVSNILSNAHKYSPVGAPIGVTVGPDGVVVDDAGDGIPADEQQLVVERFYRRDGDRSKPGSGLGLSIVAGIVEHHGGDVIVGDSPMGGARVGFRLPPVS